MTSAPDAVTSGFRLRPGPALLVAASVLVVVGSAALDAAVTDADRTAAITSRGWLIGLPGMPLVVAGALVLSALPRHAVGRALAFFGVFWVVDGLAFSWATYALVHDLPGLSVAYWLVARAGAGLLLAVPVVLLLFPTGHLVGGRGRWAAVAALVLGSLLPLALVLAPDAVVFDQSWPGRVRTEIVPLDVRMSVMEPILLTSRTLTLLSIPATFAVVLVRARRAGPEERRQLAWLLWAGMVTLLCVAVLTVAASSALGSVALAVIILVNAASVGIGVLRPDLGDVDALVAATLTFTAVAVVMLVLDLAVLSAVTALVGERLTQREVTVLVLLLAVSAYGPLRAAIGGLVRRLLFGLRADRYDVVSGFAARLEEAASVEGQVPVLASAVARAFKVPFARVEVALPGGGSVSADHGTPTSQVHEVEIAYRGEQVGRLVLPRQGLRSLLSRRDRDLLVDLVRQAAVAVRAGLLAREVQESRERLVLSREEDRRRIRRDLHDGLGPVLGGVAMRLDAAGNAIERDPASARALVRTARTEVAEALDDVRRLVHDLRPPALDDLGLPAALAQQADRARGAVAVDLDTDGLGSMPAAVEVAVLRIVSEALTNVVRHSGATRCHVSVRQEPAAVVVTVSDDGRGIGPDVVAGVGLLSLRERAEELGGQCEVVCHEGGGTTVRALLPHGLEATGPVLEGALP
ncbi:sensor histidine kinase [Nocardioides marmoribigeumensis]|uniref:histidine kinase n=1 Tax=Nocardioides marmoribigeumensis TaxID=433649 RepID=A0ABU2BYI0_9ACTN|nr:sensor histidine kinase [Nocardioides marmoribigeumensis]MDR7363466.1 signal transduction histidine kinase/drug/metabolite transporter superfamily protein YnfA [Nocardioides marmoribigeumensis]